MAALGGVGVPVHPYPPQSLSAPCVVITPGSPWIVPRGHVTLEIVGYANSAGGPDAALTRLEDLVEKIRIALFSAQLAPQDTAQPVQETDAGVISAATPVTLRTACP